MAEVDLESRQATVEIRPGAVTERDLLRAIDQVDTRLRLRHWFHRLLGMFKR